MNEQTLVVVRSELIDLLTTARSTLDADYQAAEEALDQAIEEARNPSQARAAWHEMVAQRLRAGTAVINDANKIAHAPGQDIIPPCPQRIDAAMLERGKKTAQADRKRDLAVYDNAIALLQIGAEDNVTVPVAQYERLLNQPHVVPDYVRDYTGTSTLTSRAY